MGGLLGQMEIARRALLAEQNMMSVLSHNISNANTPGFTRQDALLGATSPADYFPGQLGTGVSVDEIRRMRDSLTDVQVRSQGGSAGRWGVRAGVFGDLQKVFNEPSDTGLNSTLGQFFNSWQDLANHPEDKAYKTAVVGQSQSVVDQFHTMDANLKQVAGKVSTQIQQDLDTVNKDTGQIAQLNQQIEAAVNSGQQPNDLMDRRDQLLDELSKLANITYDEHGKGAVTVRVGGLNLVEGSTSRSITSMSTVAGQVTLHASDGSSGVVLRGELGALQDARDTVIPGYQSQLDQLAAGFAAQVNGLEATGPRGTTLFTGATAATIDLNPAVSADPGLLDPGTTAAAGDNSLALKIAGLRDAMTMGSGTSTFQGFYGTLTGSVAGGASQASDMSQNQTLLLQQMQNQRDSVGGVNLEEEMTQLLTAQKSFQAASQLVTTVSNMMDTVLTMVGR